MERSTLSSRSSSSVVGVGAGVGAGTAVGVGGRVSGGLNSQSFLNAPLTTVTPTRLHTISASFAQMSVLPSIIPLVDDSHYHHDLQRRIRADVQRITDYQSEYLTLTRQLFQHAADIDDSLQTVNIINRRAIQVFRNAHDTATTLAADLQDLIPSPSATQSHTT